MSIRLALAARLDTLMRLHARPTAALSALLDHADPTVRRLAGRSRTKLRR